MLQFEDLGR